MLGFLAGSGLVFASPTLPGPTANPVVPPDTRLLQLALGPRQAAEEAAPKVALPPPVEVDLPAEVTVTEDSGREPFRPEESQVRLAVQEVNARELLKKERTRIHGSLSVGINSEGDWETTLELYQQLTPSISLGIGISVGRWDRWD